MLRSALLILSGNAIASLLLLARNLIIARLIPVADYGIASTLAIAMAVVEMMSALGLQQQIIQSGAGEDPRFQAALQGFQLLRGVISAMALVLLAGPVAAFLGVPEAAWAYQAMALVPLLNAAVHFDIYRLNRQMVFLPGILTGVLPALVSVLMIWPLVQGFGDYRVMLYAILGQAGMTLVLSHLVARRPWRLVLDRAIIGQSLRFGWPLLVNNVLLLAVFQGDKLVVGRELGMAPLAIFAMGFTLTLTPTLIMAKSAQNFFLPQLVQARDDAARFGHVAAATMQAVMAMALALVAGVMILGGPVVHLLLGPKYAGLLPLLTALTLMQALRVFKAGGAIIALARGQTGNAMLANLARVLSLPLCWYVAATSGDLRLIIWIAILGEAVGFALSLWLLAARSGLELRGLAPSVAASCGALGLLAVLAAAVPDLAAGTVPPLWAGLGILALCAACIWIMRDLRAYIAARGHPPQRTGLP